MKILIGIGTIVATCVAFSCPLFAQDKSGTPPIVAVSKDAKARLRSVRTVAIFLSGNDAVLIRVVEDALALHLVNKGFAVVNREMLEKTVGEQVSRKKAEKGDGTAINALEIGSAVNADSIVTGTIVIEPGEQRTLLAKLASFQLVDVGSGRTLTNVFFESEKGRSLSETTKGFADILRQALD